MIDYKNIVNLKTFHNFSWGGSMFGNDNFARHLDQGLDVNEALPRRTPFTLPDTFFPKDFGGGFG